MTIEIIECPHCGTRVVPLPQGTCPACRKNTQQEPALVPVSDSGPTRDEAWDQYQKSLRFTPVEPAIDAIRQVEQAFVEVRTHALAQLQANAGADRGAADRIDQELLPRFAEAVEQLEQAGEPHAPKGHDTSQLIEYVKTREKSWQLLGEAIRENDTDKLQQHIELWDNSEMLMVGIVAGKQSLAKPTSAQHVREFQQALVTFTPHLIATPVIVIANTLVFVAMIATGIEFRPRSKTLCNGVPISDRRL